MWKKASSCTLLLAAFAAFVSAQNAASGSDVLFTLPITVDGSVKDLQLMRGESFEDAAATFVRKNALANNNDATRVREMVDQLSGLLRGRMEEIRAKETPQPVVQVSMPLTISGVTRELQKLESETVEAAVERYLYDGGYTMDVMRELYPQLVQLLVQKLEEIKPAKKELFSLVLTIDGREATVRHFEKGDLMEEARETLRSVNVNDPAMVDRMAPQIANVIRQRIEADLASQAPEPPVQQAPVQQAPQPPAPATELFSIPLTVNERPTVLVHYEGYTSRESATRYLNENALSGDSADQLMVQVIQIIDNRIAEIAREQAAQEAAARAAAEEAAARAKAEENAATRAATPRQPMVRLPINFGESQEATLEYFEGDSIERTVELFLTQLGLQESSTFAQNVASLSDAVRQEMKTIVAKREAEAAQTAAESNAQTQEQQQPRADPLVQFPVTLSGRIFDLVYFEGEEPATVANTFCVEKHEVIRAELGLQFDGEQLVECKKLLDRTLRDLIAQKQQQKQEEQQQPEPVPQPQQPEPVAEPQAQPQAQPPQQPRSRGEVLFSLDIAIDNENVPLTMHQNDNAEDVARAFCEQYKVDLSNVGPLVHALNEQLAQLK